MFYKKIEFICNEKYLKFTKIKPEPSVLNIPQWYKNLTHTFDNSTIKGCIPFLDTLTAGYILKMPIDYRIKHNIKKDGVRHTHGSSVLEHDNKSSMSAKLNINKLDFEMHQINQLGKECPYIQKNKDLPIHKILNPWIIKTPPGYSCLFVPPLNNADDRFSIIPGIVDTDTFPQEVNFPMIINGDKYPILETVVKIGTPYVQVIPFKRDKWKMSFGVEKNDEKDKRFFWQKLTVLNTYKNNWWSKKLWK